jgi:drug/metabolite transporter (DMT)-like permease
VSGVSITVSLLYCKRLQDHGVAADALTAVRYLALILLAAIVAPWNGQLGGVETAWQLAILLLATITLIILPLYVFQLGIGRTSPLTAQVIKALGPVFVFAMEQLDGRVHYSALTLMCILIYSGSVVLSNVAHGWYSQQEQFILSEERTSLR